MRDLLSKLDAIVSETELKNPEDLQAKRKALQDLQMDPVASKDPEISQAIIQRKADLEREAKSKGFDESFELDREELKPAHDKGYGDAAKGIDKNPFNPNSPAFKSYREGQMAYKRSFGESFEIGDEFGISFSEDHEIATTIVDMLEDGIVIELDDTALDMLTNEGLVFLEGELVEDKQKGVDGKACWKGYKRMGTKQKGGKTVDNCVKMEDHGPENPDAPVNYGEYDREGDMAKDDLRTIDSAAEELYSILQADDNLPEWVQSKITKAVDYIDTARDYMKAQKYEEGVTEGSAHGYNVAKWYEKNGDQKKLTNWLRKEAGLEKNAPLYFDDVDLVHGDQTIVPNALINPKLKFNDLLTAVVQATGGTPKQNVDGVYRSQGVEEGDVDEAKYQGREVPLGKKMAGDVKKSKVYVRKPNGNIVKVNFGDKKMRIKKSNPARRKSFRARHNCANPGPRHKARYWSCRSW
jgi:hypothetical protein